MYIYGLNIVVIGLLYYFIYHSKVSNKYFLKLALLYLFCISSFRNRCIGTDYTVYVQIFYQIIRIGHSYLENGYDLLNRVVGLFTHHYVGLAIAVNTLLFVPLYKYIENNVSPRYWGICVFIFAANPYMFIQSTFNVLRQTCATGIILVGMNALLNWENKKRSVLFFILTAVIAAQFHRVAYAMIIVPIVLTIKWKKAHWKALAIAAVILNFVGVRMLAVVSARVLHLGSSYINYKASMLNNPVYVFFVLMVIFFLLTHYEVYAIREREKKLIDFYLFSLCFLIIALPNDAFYRVYMIFSFCALPGVPAVCEATRLGFSRIRFRHEELFVKKLYVIYYFAFYTGYVALLAIKHNYAYVPFRFYFN